MLEDSVRLVCIPDHCRHTVCVTVALFSRAAFRLYEFRPGKFTGAEVLRGLC
jgi:hypothetical protein